MTLWNSDADALRFLARHGIREVRNGIFVAPERNDGWMPTCWAAAHYLCDEWDFCIVRADDPILKPRIPPEATWSTTSTTWPASGGCSTRLNWRQTMITADQIPDEVVEAAANEMALIEWCDTEMWDVLIKRAESAIAAAINAWPDGYVEKHGDAIILPLPQKGGEG